MGGGRTVRLIAAAAGCVLAAAGAARGADYRFSIAVTYDGAFPPQAKPAVEHAVGLWESWIADTAPGGASNLELTFRWESMGGTALGSAGPSWRGHDGGLTLTPAQYMFQTGTDPQGADGVITLNSDQAWYTGTDGRPGGSQYDLPTVVLHEIGHQMGMLDSYHEVPALGWGWGFREGPTDPWELTRWDTFLRDQDGDAPAPRGSPESFDEVGNVTFHGPAALAANGGEPVVVYAPDPHREGVSLTHVYHINETDALMAPFVPRSASRQGLHDHEQGIFTDLGWTFVAPAEAHARGRDGFWHHGADWVEGLPPTAETAVRLDATPPSQYGLLIIKDAFAASVDVSAPGQLYINGKVLTLSGPGPMRFGDGTRLWAADGSVIRLAGAGFQNESTDPADLEGLADLTLIFEGGAGVLADFEAAGADVGADPAGWTDNFAVGTLQLGGADAGRVRLVDDFDNRPAWPGAEALYVAELVLDAGAAIDLNGLRLYYLNGGQPKQLFHGDVNLDGSVGYLDLGVVATHYGMTGGSWSAGDFTGDEAVSYLDLGVLAASYGATTGAAPPAGSVPEPGLAAFLAVGGVALIRRGGYFL